MPIIHIWVSSSSILKYTLENIVDPWRYTLEILRHALMQFFMYMYSYTITWHLRFKTYQTSLVQKTNENDSVLMRSCKRLACTPYLRQVLTDILETWFEEVLLYEASVTVLKRTKFQTWNSHHQGWHDK